LVILLPERHTDEVCECANHETAFQKLRNIGHKRTLHINFSMISYWKSFICNKHVMKGILFDKTDN